ncbi:MAG: hypothetical protein VX152_02540 [Pseudomonadota bacterium]|nr:hypothetical protein [Pseudomonadota bacterium]
MDRSDDVTRSRRFTAQSLGSQQNRPRIVTARDERVAVKPGAAANKSQQPSLEFRARQRLRTYAEASAILDRQVPANASEARVSSRSTLAPKPQTEPTTPAATAAAMPEGAPTMPETGYANVIPEPPSPMAEVYVGNSPQLTEREAQEYDLAPTTPTATTTTPAEEAKAALDPAPVAVAEAEPVAELEVQAEVHAEAEAETDTGWHVAEDNLSADEPAVAAPEAGPQWSDERPFQTQRPSRLSQARESLARTGQGLTTALAKSSNLVNNYATQSAGSAASMGERLSGFGLKLREGAAGLLDRLPSLPGVAAPTDKGTIEPVSQLPANSLLTPLAGRLAPSARADAANARPDANVRPVSSDGALDQDPGLRRTLQARKIKNDVERTETRTAAPVGPIGQARRTPMALSTVLVLLCMLGFIALAAWFTISVQQRTSQPITTIGETERYRVEAILDALFINPGPVDGVIDDRSSAAIGLYAAEYGFAGEAVLSAELLQHLETEARAMGVLDLIK